MVLAQELKKYEKENETLKKLQAHAKQAERDIAREREKLWKEADRLAGGSGWVIFG